MTTLKQRLETSGYVQKDHIFLKEEDNDFFHHLNQPNKKAETTSWNTYNFNNRSLIPYTTSFYEKKESLLVLENILNQLGQKGILLELGSGDGRFTDYLSQLDFSQIIFNDLHFNSLLNIKEEVRGKRNVLSVAGDAFSIPIENSSVDTIIAWGIFSLTTRSYKECLDYVFQLLKPGGICVIAEPLLHAHLVYSLIRHNIDEFKRTLITSTRAESTENPDTRYKLNTLEYYEGIIEKSDLRLVDKGGISLLPSLFFGGVCQENEISKESLEEISQIMINNVLMSANSGLIRQAYWVLEK